MHPTDHMSTENKNEMKVNKKTGTEQQINEKTYPIMLYSTEPAAHTADTDLPFTLCSCFSAWACKFHDNIAGLRKINSNSFLYPSVEERQYY